MNTQQQNPWLTSFGLIPSANIATVTNAAVKKGNCSIDDKAKPTRELRKDIQEKIESGIVGRGNIYQKLLNEGKIPVKDGNPMSIKAFGLHLAKIVEKLEKSQSFDRDSIPAGKKSRKILELFDSGVSELEISQVHGFTRDHTYITLVKYGRTEKRSHQNSLRKDQLKLLKITQLLIAGCDIEDICKQVNTSRKYVNDVIRFRRNAFKFLSNGAAKTTLELCQLVPVSTVHAESLIAEFLNEKDK